MNILKVGKVIEKIWFKIIIIIFIFMVFVSGFVFYFFAWRAFDYSENFGIDEVTIKKNLLDNTLNNLSDRSNNLNNLKQNPIYVSDIFK